MGLRGGEDREGVEGGGVKSSTMDEESEGKVLQKTEVSKRGGGGLYSCVRCYRIQTEKDYWASWLDSC